MSVLRVALTVFGILALLMGGLWFCQGMGIVHWPARSFMLDQRPWALRGAILAAFGIVLVIYARRRR